MSQPRSVALLLTGTPTTEGAGVHLNRVFGYPEVPKFDPFLLLDDFASEKPEDYLAGFPWHPHRGIETVTYLLAGEVMHEDSLGNHGVIGPGDTVNILPGTYAPTASYALNTSGTADSVIVYRRYGTKARLVEAAGAMPVMGPTGDSALTSTTLLKVPLTCATTTAWKVIWTLSPAARGPTFSQMSC